MISFLTKHLRHLAMLPPLVFSHGISGSSRAKFSRPRCATVRPATAQAQRRVSWGPGGNTEIGITWWIISR